MQIFLIFEKMEGGTLLDMIERRGHLTEQEARLVICDVARALSFLHKKGSTEILILTSVWSPGD